MLTRLLLLLFLASCTVPPKEAYSTSHDRPTKPEQVVDLGHNTAGETCTQLAGLGTSADIYCGTWTQPSGRVRLSGPATAGDLLALTSSGPWRAALDTRYICGAAQTTSLGNNPATVLSCTRRVGGWPHVAVAVLSDGQAWLADGVTPALPVFTQSIGALSGHGGTAAQAIAGFDGLLAQRLAARAFSSGDIGQYEALMAQGRRANLADDPAAAEAAYRSALSLHEKLLGRNDPALADPLMHVALQLSNERRFADADVFFARASALAPESPDETAAPRLQHYLGLHAFNQGKTDEAIRRLDAAQTGYAKLTPLEGAYGTRSGLGAQSAISLKADPRTANAVAGYVEALRSEAVVLRAAGRLEDGDAMVRRATQLARLNGAETPILLARLTRTEAAIAEASGSFDRAAAGYGDSDRAFAAVLPESRPQGVIALVRAGALVSAGRPNDALAFCRQGVRLLSELRTGVAANVLGGCLTAYFTAAERDPASKAQLYAEMFAASQLAQGSTTTQQIVFATARLAENSRDQAAGRAIRQRDDAVAAVASAERMRESALTAPRIDGAPARAPDLDRAVTTARDALTEAETAVQEASPTYNQLTQGVVSASDAFAALRPGEVFASITLADDFGWTILLRDGVITVARVAGGSAVIDPLVHRIRAAMVQANPMPRFDVDAAAALYTGIFGAVADGLSGATSLVVAPTGSLLSLPFEVLLTGPGHDDDLGAAPWLLRRMAVTHVPAAANFVGLRKIAGRSRAGQPWFGFGDPVPVTLKQASATFGRNCGDSAQLIASLPALGMARAELGAGRQIFRTGPDTTMLGTAFTAPSVLHAPLDQYRVLHFASHAVLPTELQCLSEAAIITSAPAGAPDAAGALLTSSEIATMRLDAELVILSACNTGGADNSLGGESLSGLARSFFFAGARGLLVTHWDVNDRAAAYLVSEMLKHTRDGAGAAEALRVVQLSAIDDARKGEVARDFVHPFFWAPFVIIGEGGGQGAGRT